MKKKTTPAKPKQKRDRLAKIAKAPTLDDKFTLARNGMTAKEFYAQEMSLARAFFETRHVDTTELMQRIQHEQAKPGEVTARTEAEYGTLKSAEKRLYHFAWTAARRWKPEMFEALARAMRRIQRHKFPDNHDGWRRCYLIGCNGNVAAAVKCIHWPCDPDLERDKLNRLKKTLFPKDT
jgi:hypothetical protein